MTDGQSRRYGFEALEIMEREDKPRRRGLTYVRDAGLGTAGTAEMLETAADWIDIVKLAAFSHRLQSREMLAAKVEMCREHDVEVGVGGVLIELAALQGARAVEGVLDEMVDLGISHVEISRNVTIMSVDSLLALIESAAERGLHPIAEVGVAYGISADDDVDLDVGRVVSTMRRCLDAGAWRLLLESEGITESRHPRDQRWDVVSTVAHSFDLDVMMFEADAPDVWNRYIHDLGPEVNLFVDHSRVLRLEAARRGAWAQPKTVIRRVANYRRPEGEERR